MVAAMWVGHSVGRRRWRWLRLTMSPVTHVRRRRPIVGMVVAHGRQTAHGQISGRQAERRRQIAWVHSLRMREKACG